MLQVDPWRKFMGAVTKEMENHKTFIRRGRNEIHRDQAIVERFNRTLAGRLFGHQYAVEMRLPRGPAVYSMGEKATRSCFGFEQRGDKPCRQETRSCHQRKSCCFEAFEPLFPARRKKRKKANRPCKSAPSLPTRRAGRRRPPKSRGPDLVSESLERWKIFRQT